MKSNIYGYKKLYEECGADPAPSSAKAASRKDKIAKLSRLLNIDEDMAEEALMDAGWDLQVAHDMIKGGKKKKPKDKKIFKVGDKIVCIDPKPSKTMPPDCIDFLVTYKYFKVIDVNDKLNIDIGHRLAENGNPYYFSPNRFELKDGIAPIQKAEPEAPTAKKVSGDLDPGGLIKKMAEERARKEALKKKINNFGDYTEIDGPDGPGDKW